MEKSERGKTRHSQGNNYIEIINEVRKRKSSYEIIQEEKGIKYGMISVIADLMRINIDQAEKKQRIEYLGENIQIAVKSIAISISKKDMSYKTCRTNIKNMLSKYQEFRDALMDAIIGETSRLELLRKDIELLTIIDMTIEENAYSNAEKEGIIVRENLDKSKIMQEAMGEFARRVGVGSRISILSNLR